MKTSLVSVRIKILLPAAVAVVATIIATAVILALMGSASKRLARVEHEDFPAFRVSQEIRASLERLHLLLAHVADSGEVARLQPADALRDEIVHQLEWEGIAAYGQGRKEEIRSQFDEYVKPARELAAGKALRRRDASADADHGIVVEARYGALQAALDTEAKQAQRTMIAAFADARAEQRLAIVATIAILSVCALASLLFAWFLSGRLSRPIRVLSEVALKVADGDLQQEVRPESRDEVGVLAASFQRMVTRLREMVATLKAAAQELGTAADQLSDNTRAQSAMLERQATGVAETSSTTRELEQTSSMAAGRAASVLEVARRAAEMSDVGRDAAEASASELRAIQGSVEGMLGQSGHLLEQARQVSDIVETVRDLATQSHVLSLNASIEAARAGAAGMSFAVVAQEVRALAEQSGQGAARIARMVEEMLTAVQATRDTTERGSQGMAASLDRIRASGESLRGIGGIVRETSDAALQIASAVQQQSTGIAQIAAAMRDLDAGMEESVNRIHALETSAHLVADTASRISDIAAGFTV